MQVLEGEFSLADHIVNYASGTSIAHWPESGGGLIARDLNDQGECVLYITQHPLFMGWIIIMYIFIVELA